MIKNNWSQKESETEAVNSWGQWEKLLEEIIMCDQLSSHPCHLEFQIAVKNMCRLALWYKSSINYTHQIWIPPYW